ncbi:hypothetical protein KKG90_00555 [Candidatus Bipolaricaulota bacterium]|nr:hypothetical protein [Candidatus Bipolaricaulota bacterium]
MKSIHIRTTLCAIVGICLFSPSALGYWVRPALPTPSDGAVIATVGVPDCDFATLREAVSAVPSGSVLRLQGGVFTEGGISLDKDLFIVGAGPGVTIVQASESLESASERVFSIETGATVVIQGITMRYGHPLGECSRGGGAIANYGDLWLDGCVVSDNIGQCGGGLMNRDGNVTAFDSMFIRNHSDGGTDLRGVEGNGAGGGVKNIKGNMVLDGCTIADNVAKKKGGGVKNSCLGILTMVNCTVTGNDCKSGNVHLNGPAVIDHCTIAFNTAPFSLGAGIFVNSASIIRNTIVYGNTMGDVTVEWEDNASPAQFVNVWIGDGRTGMGTYAGDPLLSSLADHGGPTWTHLLLSGSGAIDAAIPTDGSPLVDQRGFPRACGAGTDIGAVEIEPTD